MRRVLKWLRLALIGVFVLGLLAVAVVTFTLGTHAGTRWAFNRIDAAIPGSIDLEQFDGTLWAGLQIPTLVYRDAERELRVQDVALDVSWSAVAAGQLTINVLNADTVDYRSLVATDATPGPFELSMDPLPVAIVVSGSRINRITMAGDGEPTEIQYLQIDNAFLKGNALGVGTVSAAVGDIIVSAANLDTKLAGEVPFSTDVSWSLAGDTWSGNGTFRATLASLEFEHVVSGPYPATLSGELKLLQRIQPEVDALVNWQRWPNNGYVLEDGEVRIRGTADAYDASYDLSFFLPSGESGRLSGTAAGNSERLSAFQAKVSHPDVNADLSGSLAWLPFFVAEAQVHASGFDPNFVVENLSGSVDADAFVRVDDSGNLDITNAIITGELNDAPINASGNVAVTPEQVSCDDCVVAVGNNRVSVDGVSSGAGLASTDRVKNIATVYR